MGYVETTKAETKSKAMQMMQPHKLAIEQRLQTLYTFTEGKWVLARETSQYAALAAAYKNAIERCEALRDVAITSVGFTKDKIAVLFNDGAVALVDNLRADGMLPAQGDLTLKNLANKSKALAMQLVELSKTSPAIAFEKAKELYVQLLEASKNAPEQIKTNITELLALTKEQAALYSAYVKEESAKLHQLVQDKAHEFVELAKKSPEMAKQLAETLFKQLDELKEKPQEKFAELTAPLAAKLVECKEHSTEQADKIQSYSQACKDSILAKVEATGLLAKAVDTADYTFDLVAPKLMNLVNATSYGQTAFDMLGKG